MYREFCFILLLIPLLVNAAKPNLLIFTGPDECPWSNTFISEILSHSEFKNRLAKEVELFHIPYSDETERKIYQVSSFPTLILFSSENERWVEIPYLPLSPNEYAEQILERVVYKSLLGSLTLDLCDLSDLKELYLRALRLGFSQDAKKLLEIGFKKEKGTYFLLEKYEALIRTKKRQDFELHKLRELIKARDPKNEEGAHFRLAVLDFELREKKKRVKNSFKVVEPLLDYIQNFRNKDKENLWQAEMLLARYFLNKNNAKAALEHARNSLAAAPEEMKPYVQLFIDSF